MRTFPSLSSSRPCVLRFPEMFVNRANIRFIGDLTTNRATKFLYRLCQYKIQTAYLSPEKNIWKRAGNKCFLNPHVGALFLGNEHNSP